MFSLFIQKKMICLYNVKIVLLIVQYYKTIIIHYTMSTIPDTHYFDEYVSNINK